MKKPFVKLLNPCHLQGAIRKFLINGSCLTTMLLVVGLFVSAASAAPFSATIAYQPMTSEGLAAGYPFEAWVVFDKNPDPTIQGYSLPAGATFRFTFPEAFVPQLSGPRPSAVLLYGWVHGAAHVPFTIGWDPKDPRTIVLRLTENFLVGPPERPGLKAIHLRFGPLNPTKAGDYPITIQLVDAGELSGITQATAQITSKPVPNIAAYNALHDGRNENWQRVKKGRATALPIDLLVTLPDRARSFISLRPTADGNFDILSDMAPIGKITRRGAPLTLKPEPFGPGQARLGIIRYYVTAGSEPGLAEIEAELQGGTHYKINVVIE